MQDQAIRVDRVSKRFRMGAAHDSLGDVLAAFMQLWRAPYRRRKNDTSFWALRDLAFDLQRGEALGIIGPNGAGKSTALRLLAGILHPDEGSISIRGRLAALIEVGAGFHGDLTGRENIFLNGAILGMSRAEVKSKLDAIVAFAHLERFLDMPVKRYSSGMYARLGFSIAAHVDPDVLLVDEVLSVGDAVFRLRCMERMRELVANGTSLVFVTHNLEQMMTICDRTIVLDHGRTVYKGRPRDAVGQYMKAVTQTYATRPTDAPVPTRDTHSPVEVLRFGALDKSGVPTECVSPDHPVKIEMQFRVDRPVRQLVAEFNLRESTSENLLSFNSGRDDLTFVVDAGVHTLTLALPSIPLAGGQYFWNLRMWDAATGDTLLDTPLRYPLLIDDGGRATGRLAIEHLWFHTAPAAEATEHRVAWHSPHPANSVLNDHEHLFLR